MGLPEWKIRYQDAHRKWQAVQYPSATMDHGVTSTNFPDTRKANGLTRMVVQYLIYQGHRATRISSSGRVIEKNGHSRYIPGTTRRGAADVSATINGRSCMFEVKVGMDKPSIEQLREQQLERKAGGIYEFIISPEEFFIFYDLIISLTLV